ncbi:hypothetical protein WDU94_010910 [Cyamophila willieti]
MNWRLHINHLRNRGLNALNALKMVCNKMYGVRRDKLLSFYKSYVLPIFDYGCAIYGSAKENSLNRLNPVHNAGIRIATGALRSSPVSSLYVESGISPLSLRRDKLSMRYVSKVSSCPFNPMCNVVVKALTNDIVYPANKPKPLVTRISLIQEFICHVKCSVFLPYEKHEPPWCECGPHVDKSLHIDNKTNVSPLVFQKHFSDIINTKYSNHVIAYTDGSKSVNSVSCAYLIDQHVFSIRLNQVTSIFSAELMGIFLCLLNIQFLPATRFLVVSDSMSALEAIKSNNYNNPLISKIYNQWVKLETYGKYLSFMWCPSHIGIKGNEAVDQAASNPSLTLNPIKACSDQDFKPLIAKIIKTRWQNSWNSIPSTNKLKQTKPLVDPWDSSNRNTRVEEVVLTRVRIGHTRLTHSYLFTRSPQPTCNCGESLTVKHILTCPTHAQLRTTLPCPPLPIDNTKSCDALIYYLKSINLFHRI